jgi:hypothetical protein
MNQLDLVPEVFGDWLIAVVKPLTHEVQLSGVMICNEIDERSLPTA